MEFKTIFLIVWAIAFFGIAIIGFINGKKALSVFPTLDHVNVLYREQGVSGGIHHSSLFKRKQAQRILDVIITEEELWVKAPIMFASVLKRVDLLIKTNLENIHVVNREKSGVSVAYRDHRGEDQTLLLKLKNADEFIRKYHLANGDYG